MDDIDLSAGRVQVKRGGGSTQRGIEDIVRAVRTPDFLRVRFGISQPPGGGADKSRFVLSKFSRYEMDGVKDGMSRVCNAVKVWLEKGEAHAMNIINKR
jgi:PTH1 family peptidyl-tRNA hydrolase